MYLDLEWSDWTCPPKAEEQFCALESAMLEHPRDQALKIYNGLEETCNAMMEDGYIADHLVANEYLFWSNGEPAHFHQE